MAGEYESAREWVTTGINAFDINRVYLNTYFTPTDDLTFRFTPELYRADGTRTKDKNGRSTGVAGRISTAISTYA